MSEEGMTEEELVLLDKYGSDAILLSSALCKHLPHLNVQNVLLASILIELHKLNKERVK